MLTRMRERASLFGALLGVVALVSGLAVGLVGYLADAEVSGLRTELAAQTGPDAGLAMTLVRDADVVGQDEWVRGLIARQFVVDGRAIPLEVYRTSQSEKVVRFQPQDGPAVDPAASRAFVASIPDLADHSRLVAGRWPTSAAEVSVQADAAGRLGLAPGTAIRLGGAPVVVSGTWRVEDTLDPRWLGDALVTAGSDGTAAGPIVVDESAWAAVDAPALARWTIIPIARELDASDVQAILNGWRGMSPAARADGEFDPSSLDQTGRLPRTLTTVQERAAALHAVQPLSLLVIAAIALVTLVELARVLIGLRSAETRLIWSRGATVARITAWAAIEAGAVCLVGAAAGAAVASAVLVGAVNPDAVTELGPVLWLLPLAAAAVSTLIVAVSTLVAARSLGRSASPDDAGRLARVGAPAVAVLVTAAAALSVWQLLLYGSPVAPSRDGGTEVDPLAVLAPVLALVAVVLLSLVLLPLLSPLVERAAARSRGLGGPLVARTLVRRLRLAAAPIVVCALAGGQLVTAAGYAATWSDSFAVTSELRAGAELRLTGGGLSADIADAVGSMPSVDATAAVFVGSTGVGVDEAALVGIAPGALAEIPLTGEGALDRVGAASVLRAPDPALVFPADARALTVDASVGGLPTLPPASVVLVDPLGVQRRVDLALSGESGYAADLPALPNVRSGGWRIAAFEVDVTPALLESATGQGLPRFAVSAVQVDGVPFPLAEAWSPAEPSDADYSTPKVTELPQFATSAVEGLVRMLPSLGDATDEIVPQVVISQTLADRAGLAVGDRLSLSLDPRIDLTPCTVGAIVPAVPGAVNDSAVIVDLDLLQAIHLRRYVEPADPSQLWVLSSDLATTAAALRSTLPPLVRVDALGGDPSRDILGSASLALWIGAAGSGLLAIMAVAAVTGAQLRSRRGEVAVLRALGMGARALGALRRRELATSVGIGLTVGAAAGLVVTYLTIPALARAAVPDPYPSLATTVAFDLLPLATGAAILIVSLVVIGAVYSARVDSSVREDDR